MNEDAIQRRVEANRDRIEEAGFGGRFTEQLHPRSRGGKFSHSFAADARKAAARNKKHEPQWGEHSYNGDPGTYHSLRTADGDELGSVHKVTNSGYVKGHQGLINHGGGTGTHLPLRDTHAEAVRDVENHPSVKKEMYAGHMRGRSDDHVRAYADSVVPDVAAAAKSEIARRTQLAEERRAADRGEHVAPRGPAAARARRVEKAKIKPSGKPPKTFTLADEARRAKRGS